MYSQKKQSTNGTALLVSLWTLIILALIITSFAFQVSIGDVDVPKKETISCRNASTLGN